MPLTTALDAVLPIFVLVAVGWGLAVSKVLDQSIGAALAVFAGRVGIPVLVFKTMIGADFSTTSPWILWACYFPAVALSWALGHVLISRLFRRDERTAVIAGIGSAFANTAFIGIPLADRAYGPHGVVIVTLLISVHLPVMMTAATLLMERAERKSGGGGVSLWHLLLQIAQNLVLNPIVLALIAAGALRLGGLALPGIADQAVHTIAELAGPVALLSLGMALHAHGSGRDLVPAIAVSVLKLVAMPAFVLIACLAVRLDRAAVGPLVVLAGVPSGINVYLVSIQFRVGQALASGAVAITTTASVLTSTLWMVLLSSYV